MYALNSTLLKNESRKRGYGGVKPLLEELGLHRNTLDRYLRGAPVLPRSVETVLSKLGIPLEKALLHVGSSVRVDSQIEELTREIHIVFPEISIFLFGSRARGTARTYSDFDIGIYSEKGIPLQKYLRILEIKEQFEEVSPYRVDCINLNNADREFISSIYKDLKMLVGYHSDEELIKKIAHGIQK